MPEFSDFLGHILKEVTRARIQADLEAIRTARMYASDESGLLKNFPIPRMRLPNVEITAPVIITDVPDGHVEKTDPKLLSQTVSDNVQALLTKQNIKIETVQITELIRSNELMARGLIDETAAEILSRNIGDQIRKTTRQSAEVHNQVVLLVREQLKETFESLPRQPVGITINARTAAVKEHSSQPGQGANVVYFKLSITEDALEINFKDPSESSGDGDSRIKRLIPE
jgi:hypothetical protein